MYKSGKDWRIRVNHMLQAIEEIESFIAGFDAVSLAENRMAYLATERNLESGEGTFAGTQGRFVDNQKRL